MTEANLAHARRYLAAIEKGAIGEELAAFFAPHVEQIEFPNRLVPNGAKRDLKAILDGAARGQKIVTAQRFEILRELASGNDVVLEVQWSGRFSVAIGSLQPGAEMRARFAVFLEFESGRIFRQRNYDCFDPW